MSISGLPQDEWSVATALQNTQPHISREWKENRHFGRQDVFFHSFVPFIINIFQSYPTCLENQLIQPYFLLEQSGFCCMLSHTPPHVVYAGFDEHDAVALKLRYIEGVQKGFWHLVQAEASGGQKPQEHYLYVVMECAGLLPLSECEAAPVHLSAFFTTNDQTFLHFSKNSQQNGVAPPGLFEREEMSYPGLRGAGAPLHPGLLIVSPLRGFLNTIYMANLLRRRRLTMLNPRL
jgi:hypothetical protein